MMKWVILAVAAVFAVLVALVAIAYAQESGEYARQVGMQERHNRLRGDSNVTHYRQGSRR